MVYFIFLFLTGQMPTSGHLIITTISLFICLFIHFYYIYYNRSNNQQSYNKDFEQVIHDFFFFLYLGISDLSLVPFYHE